MHIFFIEILLLQTLKTFGQSHECPTNYMKIGSENQWCTIGNHVKEGYISYGAVGRWILIPFTNNAATDLNVYCNSMFGDPWPFVDIEPGQVKYCCFKSTKTAFSSMTIWKYDKDENTEWEHPNFWGTTRFGLNDQYFYTVTKDVNVWCNRQTFGANNKVENNKCNINIGAYPPQMQEYQWTLCGSASNANQFCEQLTAGAAQWVRYGNNDRYYYKLVISNSKYPCHHLAYNQNNIEAKYFKGGSALCWRSPVQYSFGIVGEWRQVTTCFGCQPLEYEVSIGISKTTEKEKTEDWFWSLTSTMSASYEFKGGGSVSTELSATVSQTVTNRVMHAITEEKVKTVKISCLKDKQSLFQWITTVTEENGVTTTGFHIDGDIYRCQDMDPLCPPEYCKDDDCQTCTQEDVKLDNSPIVHNVETHDQIKNITDVRIHSIWIYGICVFVLLLVVANFVMMLYSYSNCCGCIKKTNVITYGEDLKSIP